MANRAENIARRHLLGSASAAALPVLAGCGYVTPFRPNDQACTDAPHSGSLVVDIHCHIMNFKDADANAFVVRHMLNSHRGNSPLDTIESILLKIALEIQTPFVMSPNEEYAWLKRETPKIQNSIGAYCEAATREQGGLLYAAKNHQVFGFTSNRTRNAARLISLFPEVDIFTPSMVDLFEKSSDIRSDPEERANVYSQIAVATLGRVMPMVSFNPLRAYEDRKEGRWKRSLDFVRRCIEEKGFVGVKLHPSTGFSPVNNARYGCVNNSQQPWEPMGEERGAAYDRALQELFVYCRGADVPILTHSGYGIAENVPCMTTATRIPPNEQSNAPALWEMAIQEAKRRTNDLWGNSIPRDADLAVCMAHLAGGFRENDGSPEPHPWLESLIGIMRRNPRVYTDVSDQSEMFGDDNKEILPEYFKAFRKFLDENPIVARRLMYGTDWHMPSSAIVGRGYLQGMRTLIPEQYHRRALGLNAVDFLGLAPGRPNRKRLEAFYDRNDVPCERVAWIRKMKTMPKG